MANKKEPTDRLWVEETIDEYFDIEMSLQSIVDDLTQTLLEYPDAYFDKEYHGYDGAYTLKIKYRRQETDAEYEQRLNKEQKTKEYQIETNRKKIELLQQQIQELENSK